MLAPQVQRHPQKGISVNGALRFTARRGVIICIQLLIAAAHVIGIGRYLEGDLAVLHRSYFSDIVIPFGYYFLLCLNRYPWPILNHAATKAAAVFLMAAAAETLQYLGIWALGSTFDPLDYVMYAAGAACAALVDTQVFPRVFDFWQAG